MEGFLAANVINQKCMWNCYGRSIPHVKASINLQRSPKSSGSALDPKEWTILGFIFTIIEGGGPRFHSSPRSCYLRVPRMAWGCGDGVKPFLIPETLSWQICVCPRSTILDSLWKRWRLSDIFSSPIPSIPQYLRSSVRNSANRMVQDDKKPQSGRVPSTPETDKTAEVAQQKHWTSKRERDRPHLLLAQVQH